jgi:uncharacterized protein (TIGR02246 family)
MPAGQLCSVIHYLRKAAGDSSGVSDAQLLERYVSRRDDDAFESLVWRYGRTVLGVCRRLLRDEHEAEDAFQAAFLVLARRAHAIGRRDSVGAWLYRVAYRVALEVKARSAKRLAREQAILDPAIPSAGPDPRAEAASEELRRALDELVSRLPEKYRAVFVLCCLAGKSNAEAAWELGCAVGTVESRLTRARQRLRTALAHRGFGLAAGLLAVGLPREVAVACGLGSLVSSTVKAATWVAVGQAVKAGVVSSQVAALTEGVLRAMFWSKLKIAAALLLAMTAIGLATGGLSYAMWPAEQPDDFPVVEPRPRAGEAARPPKDADKRLRDTLLLLNKQWWDASANQDRDTFDKLLAEDYVGIAPSKEGRYTKAEILRSVTEGRVKDFKITTDVELIRLNPGAAVLTYEAKWKAFSPSGELTHTHHRRITTCWVQRDGGWSIAFCQEVDVRSI